MRSEEQHEAVYPPLDTLKPIAGDLWIVDSGPLRAMGLPIPLRMIVIRLETGEVWLHSPTRYGDRLRQQIEQVGPIRHLVAPNVAHWCFMRDWQQHCSGIITSAVPGLRERLQVRKTGLILDRALGHSPPEGWAREVDQLVVQAGFGVNEIVFLHKPTRTLVLTDLVENFQPDKVGLLLRPLVRLAGAMAPDGKAPAHLRFAINRSGSGGTPFARVGTRTGYLRAWKLVDRDATARLRHYTAKYRIRSPCTIAPAVVVAPHHHPEVAAPPRSSSPRVSSCLCSCD